MAFIKRIQCNNQSCSKEIVGYTLEAFEVSVEYIITCTNCNTKNNFYKNYGFACNDIPIGAVPIGYK